MEDELRTDNQIALEQAALIDLDAESALLAVLDRTGASREYWTDPDAKLAAAGICEAVNESDFWNTHHQLIYRAMLECYQQHGFVNRVVVQARVNAAGAKVAQTYEQGFVPLYLEALGDTGAGIGRMWPQYVGRLHDCKARRDAKAILLRATEQVISPDSDADTILRQTISDLALTRPEQRRRMETLGSYMQDTLLSELFDGQEKRSGYGSGWAVFDETFLPRGFVPGRTSVLMAKRKTGKSAIAAQLGGTLALAGASVAMATLEMSQAEMAVRMISQQSGLASTKVELGTLDDGEREFVTETVRNFAGTKLVVCDQRDRDVHQLMHWLRRVKEQFGLDVAIIDYLQLIRPHLHARETMERNVSDAFRQLLIGAQELDCHVICLSQIAEDGKAKWSAQTNDDAHLNWTVMRCDDNGSPAEDGEYLRFAISQRFGKSGTVPRLYQYLPEIGLILETHINPFPDRRR